MIKTSFPIIFLLFLVLNSFSEPPENLKGFWAYCGKTTCNIDSDDFGMVGLIFDDSLVHSYINMGNGLSPEMLSTGKYELISDTLITYERDRVFKAGFTFVNDSTIQISSDSTVSYYRKLNN